MKISIFLSLLEQRYLKHYEQKLTRTLANGCRQQPPAHFELKAAAIRRNNTFKIHLMNDEAVQIQGRGRQKAKHGLAWI